MGIKMKNYFAAFLFLISTLAYSQQDFNCGMQQGYTETYPNGYQVNPPQIGGKYAPAKTLNGAYVRIFCVFAQFTGDNKDPNDVNWRVNEMPNWANTFIGTNTNQAPYPINTISNYFHQMSNGTNHIIGYVYPTLVTVNAPSTQDFGKSNRAVLQQVDVSVDFRNFDKWVMTGTYQQIFNQSDNYVDAVYIIWRNIDYGTWGGIGDLGNIGPDSNPSLPFTTNEGVLIKRRIPSIGMTLDIGGRSDYTFENKIGLLAHEYGHYLYDGGHNFENSGCGGYAQRGLGLMNSGSGGTLAMNPQEKYLLGYTTYTDIFYNQTGSLSDYQTSHASYRIPIPLFINGVPNYNPDEFFVIANHQKNSIYEFTKTKGIYIYHVKSNYYSGNHMDMITADGLWQWSVANWITPEGLGGSSDWYCVNFPDRTGPTKLPIPQRLSVDRANGRDELQEVVRAQYLQPGPFYGRYYWWDKWYNENGGRVESPIGDNEDAFNMGYNQLFSTFSNPPTYNKNRIQTNTAVELIGNNSGVFNLQFYIDASSVLSAPPSKPQNLKISQSTNLHPLLTWEANLETDVTGYKVYKYITYELGWQYLTTTTSPTYEDPTESYCPPGQQCMSGHNVSYKVTAIDNQAKESVPSDPKTTHVLGGDPSKIVANPTSEGIPLEYGLQQNYPNPFNPSALINYAVKEAGLVKIKVFDILGSEVATLVNEIKEAGNFAVEFNAANLPSGVYIYSLQVNGFTDSKKMLLLK
jgi:M6 family metalloprotease-like protein